MVIADTLKDAQAVEDRIDAVFAAGSTRDRAQAVRRLFAEQLDFELESGTVSLAGAAGNVELPNDAHRVASLDGVEILYVDFGEAQTDTNRIRKAEADATANASRMTSATTCCSFSLTATPTNSNSCIRNSTPRASLYAA